MVEALIGAGIVLVGWLVKEFVKSGAHKKEHEMIAKIQAEHSEELRKLDDRADKQDVVNATIMTQLKYIMEGIDELKDKKK